MATINYTDEQTVEIVQAYQDGTSVQDLSTSTGRSIKSLIAKLVKEGVYIKAEVAKVKSQTKAELAKYISSQCGTVEYLASLEKCTKEDLGTLVAFFKSLADFKVETSELEADS